MCAPRHEKTYPMQYAKNKGPDKPVHPDNLRSTLLDRTIPIVSFSENSKLQLVSIVYLVDLCFTCEDLFTILSANSL